MENNETNSSAVAILVSWYMTPLAILLVFSGVIFGHPDTLSGGIAMAIVIFSSLMNVVSVILMQQSPEKVIGIRNLRVALNYLANLFLIYLLLPCWPDIWLLVFLMAIATAIYDSFQSTVVHCVCFSLFLFGIGYLTGELEGIKLWQTVMHSVTMIIFGLFVNKLIHLYNVASA